MATKRQSGSHTKAAVTEPMPTEQPPASAAEWMAEAAAQGIKPEQALALIGLGLMQNMAAAGQDLPWVWSDVDDGGSADLAGLRQRLELTQLALQTGAPLSTAEVTQLLGARPGASTVERAGLRARRLGRNVWKLSRLGDETSGFSDGFRRRL